MDIQEMRARVRVFQALNDGAALIADTRSSAFWAEPQYREVDRITMAIRELQSAVYAPAPMPKKVRG